MRCPYPSFYLGDLISTYNLFSPALRCWLTITEYSLKAFSVDRIFWPLSVTVPYVSIPSNTNLWFLYFKAAASRLNVVEYLTFDSEIHLWLTWLSFKKGSWIYLWANRSKCKVVGMDVLNFLPCNGLEFSCPESTYKVQLSSNYVFWTDRSHVRVTRNNIESKTISGLFIYLFKKFVKLFIRTYICFY